MQLTVFKHAQVLIELVDKGAIEELGSLLIAKQMNIEQLSFALARAIKYAYYSFIEKGQFFFLYHLLSFFIRKTIYELIVDDNLMLSVEKLKSSFEVDDHCFDHVHVLDSHVMALPFVLIQFDIIKKLENGSDFRGNIVEFRQLAGFMVSQKQFLVETRYCAIVHFYLVEFFELLRQTEKVASCGQDDLIEVTYMHDVSDVEVSRKGNISWQTFSTDKEDIFMSILQEDVVAAVFIELALLIWHSS